MFVKHKVLNYCDNYLRNYQKIHKCHRFKYYQEKCHLYISFRRYKKYYAIT